MRHPLVRSATSTLAAAALALSACGGDVTSPESSAAAILDAGGNNQKAMAGAALAAPFVVQVLDGGGKPLVGATVSFAVTKGGGALSASSAPTDSGGRARTTLTLGSAMGQNTVSARIGALQPLTFSAMGYGPPKQIRMVGSIPSTGVVRSFMPFAVRVVDAIGTGVPDVVVAGNTASVGASALAETKTNVDGDVSMNWQIGYQAGAQSIYFFAPYVTGVDPLTVQTTALPGPPSFATLQDGNFQTGDAGGVLATQLLVEVRDEFGNLVPNYLVSFVVTSGGGTTTPASTLTGTNGRAATTWTLGPQTGPQRVTANVTSGTYGSVQFDATALAPSTTPLWALDHRVVDADYSTSADRIVTVSANPSRMTIIDPEARTQTTIGLAYVPLSVSVDPAGTHAAVGHDGWLSYVNLATGVVERVVTAPAIGGDVVLASNGFAYVVPRSDQWVGLHGIQLSTGIDLVSPLYGPYANARIKLHPSGDYLYSATNGLSSLDAAKYDIGGGTPMRLYTSPYSFTDQFGGDVWIAGNGTRLFGRTGQVFSSSPVQAQDMVRIGQLQGFAGVQAAAQPLNAPKVFAIGTLAPPANHWAPDPLPAAELRTYEVQTLAFRGTTTLPKFQVASAGGGTTARQAEGRFLFVNAAATRVYVLVQAPAGSGLTLDWALAAFDVSGLP